MFEQSGAINKAAVIKNFLSQKPFKVFVVDENTRVFISQLSSLKAPYRTYGVSYDTLVKTLRENFSEKKCNAAIERMLEATMRLVSICLDIQELVKQFDHRWQQTMQDKYRRRKKTSAGNYLLTDVKSLYSLFRLSFLIVPFIVPYLSIGVIIGVNNEFIGDIIDDIRRLL